MLAKLLGNLRFALGLFGFLRSRTSVEEARAAILERLPRREEAFLDLAARAIYENAKSPYRRLLLHAGIQHPDLTRMVQDSGLEAALEELYEKGVYVSYEELRGLKPIQRGDLEFTVRVSDFDNPLLTAFIEGSSSGSRNQGTRVYIDLRMLQSEAEYVACLFDANGVCPARPLGVWQRRPPQTAGLNAMLRFTRMGMRPERWFSQTPFRLRNGGWRGVLFLTYATLISYLAGKPFPWPRFVPQDRAIAVAEWLVEKRRLGTPAVLDSSVSGATRVCIAANQHGLDIGGTTFRVGGEPLTPQKARIIKSAGATVITRYQMVETGIISLSCAAPIEVDDMHVVSEKFAVSTWEKELGANGESVPALVYTSLQPDCRTIMLNAESGDYGHLERRDCGCRLGELGYSLHVSTVRGYDKLTSEGVTFLGSDLYYLLDEVLPAKFGGYATDYQLVEEEDEGVPRVSIVVSPSVGKLDESAVIEAVLDELRTRHVVAPLMAADWQQAHTLRVLRQEPYTSGSRKVLPLHVLEPRRRETRAESKTDHGGTWM